MRLNFKIPKFIIYTFVSLFIFVIFQNCQKSQFNKILGVNSNVLSGKIESSSVSMCGESPARLEVLPAIPKASEEVQFKSTFSECEQNLLSGVIYEITNSKGEFIARIANPEPVATEFKFSFPEVDQYSIEMHYLLQTPDSGADEKVILIQVPVVSSTCANKDSDSLIKLPEHVVVGIPAVFQLHLHPCDAESLSEIEWAVGGSYQVLDDPAKIRALFSISGPHNLEARIKYRDGRPPKVVRGLVVVTKCEECVPGLGFECPAVVACKSEPALE